MGKKIVFLCICAWLTGIISAEACTSAIISGRMTADGRPLMWKHRDTDTEWNHIAFFSGDKYNFIGLVNSHDPQKDVWTGTNEAGFSIMNTASYNLKDDEVKEMDREGRLMRMALGICRNLEDFENFLDTLSRPMGVEANFGVIDAYGGAAYYETNNHSYVKADVNDEKIAPLGYLIYTNFSFQGREDEGMGYIRYKNALTLFSKMKKEDFTPANLFKLCSRSFYHSLLGYDLKDEDYSPNRTQGWFFDQDFIPRRSSSASIVIQGVKPGMNPELTTMWTVLGYPPVSVALPVWVKTGRIPELLGASAATGVAPLCEQAVLLKRQVFPIKRGSGQRYFNWHVLCNRGEKGILQVIQPLEDRVMALFAGKQKEWERTGLALEEIEGLYEQATGWIKAGYQTLLGTETQN